MYGRLQQYLKNTIEEVKSSGLYKNERIIVSPQGVEITLNNGQKVLNFCANNYLGLASHSRVQAAAKQMIDSHGYGMSSVRFICGTQDAHKALEAKIASFFKTEDAILFASCFDANGGVFEPLFDENDAIISDALNHASIIDGIRLCKAKRYRYAHSDMAELEDHLKEAQSQRFRIIVTDAVFSMDGDIARLKEICDLAEIYDALVMTDECHSAGVIGKTGRGSPEYHKVVGRVDIVTGTFGKALGGGLGGFVASRKEIVEMLRQRARPYLFSNSLSPAVVGASLEVFDMIAENSDYCKKVIGNAQYFQSRLKAAGFDLKPSDSAIVALMLYDAVLAQKFAEKMLDEGINVLGFYYPVVPKGQARIRIQLSAAHNEEHLEKAIQAFIKVGKELKVIS